MKLGTQTHLKMLRNLLSDRLHELQTEVHAAEQARRQRDAAVEVSEVSDRKDAAARSLQSEVGEAEQQRDVDEMLQVERALQRLDHGSYGVCAQCGEPIPLQRLLVQPAAEHCMACQKVLEAASPRRPLAA